MVHSANGKCSKLRYHPSVHDPWKAVTSGCCLSSGKLSNSLTLEPTFSYATGTTQRPGWCATFFLFDEYTPRHKFRHMRLTGDLFAEWLVDFDHDIAKKKKDRKVLLVIDNHSVHHMLPSLTVVIPLVCRRTRTSGGASQAHVDRNWQTRFRCHSLDLCLPHHRMIRLHGWYWLRSRMYQELLLYGRICWPRNGGDAIEHLRYQMHMNLWQRVVNWHN